MSLYKEDGSEVKLNFDSKKSRAKSAPARRRSSATERQYSKETLSEAYKIFDDNELLEKKLKDKNFHEAALYCGVLTEKLPKRPFEFFKRLPNRVRVLDDYHAKLREEEYNKCRMEMLRQICEREQECIEYQREKREKEERYFAGLQETYKLQKEREEKRRQRTARNRKNLARAVQQEDERLRKKRNKGAEAAEHYEATLARIEREKAEMAHALKMKGKARDNHIRKQVEMARRKKQEHAEKVTAKFEEKYAKIERMLEMQRESSQGQRSEAMQLKAQREEQLRRKTEEKHERLLRQMKERERQVKAVQLRKKELIEQEKIVRQIKNQTRREKAEQTRRAKLYARKRYVDHMESVDARIKAVEKMREVHGLHHTLQPCSCMVAPSSDLLAACVAFSRRLLCCNVEPRSVTSSSTITDGRVHSTWSVLSHRAPASTSCQIHPRSSPVARGESSNPNPRSTSSWRGPKSPPALAITKCQIRSTRTEGTFVLSRCSLLGLVISTHCLLMFAVDCQSILRSWSFYSPKSEIELLQARAADMPGPGEYEIKGVASGVGGGVQFSDANPKTDLERYIYENKDTPGPGAYSKGLPEKRATLHALDKRFGPGAKVMLIAAKLKNKLRKKKKESKDAE